MKFTVIHPEDLVPGDLMIADSYDDKNLEAALRFSTMRWLFVSLDETRSHDSDIGAGVNICSCEFLTEDLEIVSISVVLPAIVLRRVA